MYSWLISKIQCSSLRIIDILAGHYGFALVTLSLSATVEGRGGRLVSPMRLNLLAK
jgi:hypothetical protein